MSMEPPAPKEAPAPKKQVAGRMVIECYTDGDIHVEGPLLDKVKCYGMLEAARDTIKDFCDEKEREKEFAATLNAQGEKGSMLRMSVPPAMAKKIAQDMEAEQRRLRGGP